MRTRGEIRTILIGELERATERLRSASARFEAVIDSVPSGLPHPDGSVRVQQARAEKSMAIKAVREAFDRYHRFVLCDEIPDEMIQDE